MKSGKHYNHPHRLEPARGQRSRRVLPAANNREANPADRRRWNLPKGINLAEFALDAGFLASVVWDDAAKRTGWIAAAHRDAAPDAVAPAREN